MRDRNRSHSISRNASTLLILIHKVHSIIFLSVTGMIRRVASLLLVILLGWTYQAIQPPPPKKCGSPGGPPVTSPRIQLTDGRYLAYQETGTPKKKANYKIIVVHGFDSSKSFQLPASQELVDELGIYFLSFDRAGYGESDPNPKRNVKSEAIDVQELADQLEIGSKFYVVGVSMGGYTAWSCLNYIPHRLAGVALVVPAINYWWPSFPANLSRQVYKKMLVQDQRSLWIAHHVPSLLYGWMTQKWFPILSAAVGHPAIMSQQDLEVAKKKAAQFNASGFQSKSRQQGIFESLHRDLIVLFSNWEFDPMNMINPFPDNQVSVSIWQGYEDRLVPVELQRYVAERLPWIRYHENPTGGHMFLFVDGWTAAILKELLLGQEYSSI